MTASGRANRGIILMRFFNKKRKTKTYLQIIRENKERKGIAL